MIERLKRYGDEFKTFAMRGNVIDMAVGIIIGASFGKIVDSLVNDVIMPPLGWLMGRVDFSKLVLSIPTGREGDVVNINYGVFINTIISFLLVAFAVFILIKGINKLRADKTAQDAADEAAVPTVKQCPYCFTEIDIRAVKCPHCTSDLNV
ncbi:large-conductance mechanosensitive channel protein MscL [bacterium]|nr:large-conductance mechanosensitive channel protein MscL [bacterium]